MKQLYILLSGFLFGIVLVKSEVISWFRVNKMFHFQEAHMYLVIGSAVVVGALSVFIIKRFRLRTVHGEEIHVNEKPMQKGVIFGGLIFGMGWAITGACPGPIYAQIGTGAWPALATFAGAIGGMYLYAWLKPKLPH